MRSIIEQNVANTICTMALTSPLFTSWQQQYVKIAVPGLRVGEPCRLLCDGEELPFQFTGKADAQDDAEVLFRLGLQVQQRCVLTVVRAESCTTDMTPVVLSHGEGVTIGLPGRELRVWETAGADGAIAGPFDAIAGFPLASSIESPHKLQCRTLTRTNAGPLYHEYRLEYLTIEGGQYTVEYRCYQHTPYVEVAECFALGHGARLVVEWNPAGAFDHVVSHGPLDFENDQAPLVEPLGVSRPNDLLCRVQMPVVGDYYVPNNRGWLALYSQANVEHGMLGLLGLYGEQWRAPAENMLYFHNRQQHVTMTASLLNGERHWLLVTGPVETDIPSDHLYLFNRLHAEWNALRLDAHLDLTGEVIYDAGCWEQPGLLGEAWQAIARENTERIPLLSTAAAEGNQLLAAMGVPVNGVTAEQAAEALRDTMLARLQRWVSQFQGYRDLQPDAGKSVIGFSRTLREFLIRYEVLRKGGNLSDEQIRQCNAYFSFAARRIVDEGRWPHSKTTLHPLHPESARNIYSYPGEHVPDRLYWTNCLPNFQSDPLCTLIHLACIIPEHPDAQQWLRKGLDDLDNQLTAYAGKSGAWEESILYALFTLSYFLVTFRVLKNRLGINYFQDTRVRALVGWLTRYAAMYDKRLGAATWPAIGNARIPQNEAGLLLAYAGQLDHDDPLRSDCLATYQLMESSVKPSWYCVPLLAAMAPSIERQYPQTPLRSELMDELGVAMRHAHPTDRQSYLFQKIGFWKDHYENDETAFNWYAKGTPLVMDYGTYTPDAGGAHAHNLVEIPEMDALSRGYLAQSYFSETVDFTRCEMPVVLKLLWGKVRSFAEFDGPQSPPLFNYIGDEHPIGPKSWKTRLLLYVKPDYLLLFDRVYGGMPHRYNLHTVAERLDIDGQHITSQGRFDLNLRCFVQHPPTFKVETGEFIPAPSLFGKGEGNPHRQRFVRLYNEQDAIYRTLLFAQEPDRAVTIEAWGTCGVRVTTPEYTDYAFANDEVVSVTCGDVRFIGRVGWIRREACGRISAALPDGDCLQAFGVRLEGRGPWSYCSDAENPFQVAGTPRLVTVLSV